MPGQRRLLSVVLMCVVHAAEEVERCGVALDHMETKSTATQSADVQVLERVGEEVGIHEAEEPLRDIAIVAGAAFVIVRGYVWRRQGASGINGRRVKRQLVVQAGADPTEGERQILGLAVARCQAEPYVHASGPTLEESGMLQLLPRSFFRVAAHDYDIFLRRFHVARSLG